MRPKLKPISREAIPAAIAKAEHYRNLNEPGEAESICRDILAVEPDDQTATRLLGLSLIDQFTGHKTDRYREAEGVLGRLEDPYQRAYYTGLLHERRAKAELKLGRAAYLVSALLRDALRCFAEAEKLRPAGNDEVILRWNSCVRLIESKPELEWSTRDPSSR
jgi:hypothetical protein